MQFLLPAAILALVAAAVAVAVPAPPVDAASASSHHALAKRVTHTGRGTYFDVGLGNCGWHNVNSDLIVAISKDRYDDANGSNCGQYIHITNTANGHTTWVKTVDSCPGCGYNDLDLSPSAFAKLGSLDLGVLQLSWHFEAKGFTPH